MQTILFTDIESNTRLWEEHPEGMAAALARHDSILNETIHRARGTVPRTTGDGLVAVFDSAQAGSIAGGFRLTELRASTRLVGLRRAMGRSPDGSDDLAVLYATFTEGFDEHDLRTAREMLG